MAAFKGGVLTPHCGLMVPSLSALGLGVQHGPEYWWEGELSISGCLSSGPSQLEGIMGMRVSWGTDSGGQQRRTGPCPPCSLTEFKCDPTLTDTETAV